MWTFIFIAAAVVAAFVAGLLVGRRNPAIADTAANLGNQAKTVAADAKAAVTPASKPPGA